MLRQYGWLASWMDGWLMAGWMDDWLDGQLAGWMAGWLAGWMHSYGWDGWIFWCMGKQVLWVNGQGWMVCLK